MYEKVRPVKKKHFSQRLYLSVASALSIIFFDQLTKWLIKFYMPGVGSQKEIIPDFFNLVYRLNPGGAFSMFHSVEYAPVIFAVVAALALLFISRILYLKADTLPRIILLALGFIAGGATGNLIDRFIPPHHVIDFLDVYYKSYHWPAFNIADSAVCIGAALLIISGFTHPHALTFTNSDTAERNT
jgi:signal peptidase II